MSDLFFNLGRKLGRAAVPALRKSKWIWQTVAGTEEESVQAETKFGQALAGELRSRSGNAAASPDMQMVASIGKQLSAALHHGTRTFQVETMQTGAPNALALPGGFIFLDVTLLDFSQRNVDELAFVIGHEMVHVVRGHTFDRILRQVGTEMISTILGRGAIGFWLRKSGMDMLRSAHSQDTELEADEIGSDMAAAAGYDPRGALNLLQRLDERRSKPEGIGDYFGSHPPERIRIEHLKAHWAHNKPS